MAWLLTGVDYESASATNRTTVEMENDGGNRLEKRGAELLREFVGVRVVPIVPWTAVEPMRSKDELKLEDVASGHTAVADVDLSRVVYALRVKDRSMVTSDVQSLFPEDLVIVDPSAQANPGDIVVAHIKGEDEPIVRRYRQVLDDPTGDEFVVLIAGNEDFPNRRERRENLSFLHRIVGVHREL
jgi:SOS-response transcriptional repressor LexA